MIFLLALLLQDDPLPEGAVARMGSARLRHAASQRCVLFTPDGKAVTSGAADHSVVVWDADTGRELRRFPGHSKYLTGVAVSPDGRLLASTSQDGTMRVRDFENSRELFKAEGQFDCATFSPDGRLIATGSFDKNIHLWDSATGKLVRTMKQDWIQVRGVAFSPDGRSLASCGSRGEVHVWEVASGKEKLSLMRNDRDVFVVAFSPDGKTLASGGFDGTLRLCDASSGKLIFEAGVDNESIHSIRFSTDGKTIYTGSIDDHTSHSYLPPSIRAWDLNGKQLMKRADRAGRWIALSPDGKRIAAEAADGAVRLFDAATLKESARPGGHDGEIWSVAWSPDGKSLASASSDGTVRIWEASGREQVVLRGHEGPVYSVGWSPDGKTLASSGADGKIRLWDPVDGRERRVLSGHTREVPAIAFSPDGRTLASASEDGTVRFWDVESGEERGKDSGRSRHGYTALAFAPDGRTIVVGGQSAGLRLLDVVSGRAKEDWPHSTHPVYSLGFFPDGRLLATVNGHYKIDFLDLPSGGRWGLSIRSSGGAVVSPCGHLVVGWDDSGIVEVWSFLTAKRIVEFRGHSRAARAGAFSPDGRLLATGSGDFTVLVWIVPEVESPPLVNIENPRTLWKDLGHAEPAAAYCAVRAFASDPEAARTFIKDQLKAPEEKNLDRVLALLDELDDPAIEVRDRASGELESYAGPKAEAELRKALEKAASEEARVRLRKILDPPLPLRIDDADERRRVRALQILEWIGARDLLGDLEKYGPTVRVRREAAGAVRRLDSRARRP